MYKVLEESKHRTVVNHFRTQDIMARQEHESQRLCRMQLQAAHVSSFEFCKLSWQFRWCNVDTPNINQLLADKTIALKSIINEAIFRTTSAGVHDFKAVLFLVHVLHSVTAHIQG
jgi:hypothetical protein